MKAAFVQFAPAFGAKMDNLARALALAEGVAADLYVLPELFTTGYCFRDREELATLAEPVLGGFTVGHLHVWCRRRNAFICAGLAEVDGPKLYNSAVLVGPRGLVNVYRKAHLFWREKELFDRNDEDMFEVCDIGLARVGMMVCFDWVYPETARVLALRGAQILLHPANLVLPFCPPAMVTRCVENRVFAVTANRTGTEEGWGKPLTFIGASRIVGPRGDVLAEAGEETEAVGVAELDPAAADDKKMTPLNDLFADRRVEFYEDLLKRS
jgi:predicted amidohydrolase